MRFLPENRKKTIRSVLLLVISVAGIIYFNLFTGSQKPPAAPPTPVGVPTQVGTPVAPPPSPVTASSTLPTTPPPTASSTPVALVPPPAAEVSAPVPAPTPVPAAPRVIKRGPGVLPYGAKIDLGVLELEEFKGLHSAGQLIVRPDELGRENPFTK